MVSITGRKIICRSAIGPFLTDCMMRVLVSILAWMVCGLMPQGTALADGGPLDGVGLLKECEDDSFYCLGYISGIFEITRTETKAADGLLRTSKQHRAENGSVWCEPPSVTNEQARLVVVKWLKEHPEKLHFAPATLVAAAFEAAFPCK